MTRLPRLLNSSMGEVRRITPYDGSLSLNIVPLSTATLTVSVNEGIQRGDWIEMFTERGSAGIFRVRSGSDEYSDELTTLQLDHAVAEIGDYICDGKINESSTFSSALNTIFRHYKGSKWALSEGNFSDPVVIDVSHDNVLEAMLSIMEQQPQYYMAFDFSSTPWTIIIKQRDTIVSAEGRLSRNITSASVEYDDSELYTRVIVEYGNSGETTTETINASVEAVRYGVHEYYMSQSGYTKEQAETAANVFLNRHKQPSVAISISGVDLSTITGEALDTLDIGKLYRLTVPKHGVVVQECITALNWSSLYSNPKNVQISLADVDDPVVAFMKATKKSGGGTKKQLDKSSERYVTLITETQSYFSRQMHDMREDLHSEIIQTASEIKTMVWSSKSELYSSIMQTSTNIYIQVGNAKSDLHSAIQVTASSIRSEVSASKSSIYSVIMQTATNIYTQVGNAKSDMYSRIEQTASSIRADVWAAKSSLYSTIMQTATNIYTEVGNTKSDMYSRIEQTASSIRMDVWTAKSALYSTIMQTSTNIYTQVGNAKSDMVSRIEQTASSIRTDIWTAKSALYSTIMQTSTNIYIQVGDAKSDMVSRIEQTASSIRSDVSAAKSSLYSSIMQTSTNIYVQVGDAKSGLYSSIESTASSISLKVGKDEVISCINQTAEQITIKASKVNLDGYVKATELTTDWLSAKIADIASISVQSITSARGGISVYSVGTTSFTQGGIDCYVPHAISALQITSSGNTYTLQKKTFASDAWVDVGSFNRAATPTLSGSWSSGTLTVTSSPAAVDNFVRTLVAGAKQKQDGSAYSSGNTWYVPINASYGSSGQYSEYTGWRVYVDATDRYNAGKAYADGLYTQWKTGNQSLYYWDTDSLSYKQATGSGKKWFYKT